MDESRLDSLGMWEAAARLPEQVGEAAGRVAASTLPDAAAPRAVAVLASGSAALAGEVVAMAAAPAAPVPVQVVDGYRLPAFVGPRTLVLALSYEGETEETLTTAIAALEVGARLVAVTAGGSLGALAEEAGELIPLPEGLPAERTAVAPMVAACLVVLDRGGVAPEASGLLPGVVEQLRRRRDQLLAEDNPARALARQLGPTLPLLHGTDRAAALAAHHWKSQVNLNAKAPAFWAPEPGAFHDEAAGWGVQGDVTRQVLTLVRLRHSAEHPALTRRAAWVEDLLLEVVSDVIEVRAQGDSELAQCLDLVLLGDFVSLHLAAAAGVDPGPAPAIDRLSGRTRAV